MRFRLSVILLLLASPALAQLPVEETAQMRSQRLERQFPREISAALPEPHSYSWQLPAPKSLRNSLKVPLPAEPKLEPRLASADRGHVERQRPALEQLALGLSADPPRPQYPLLAAGPRAAGPTRSTFEVVQLPPLSKTSDAPLTLEGDPATVAARPYTAALATASRGPAPPRSDIVIPDPFVIRREARLPPVPPDRDPPALSFGIPQRPELPVQETK